MIVRKNVKQYTPKENKSFNTYGEFTDTFIDGLINDITKYTTPITHEQLKEYLANPDKYFQELSDLVLYYYLSGGEIYLLHKLFVSLPTLAYKIKVFDTTVRGYEKNESLINQTLFSMNYKKQTREIMSNLLIKGTVIGMVLGSKKEPYIYCFPDLNYAFASHRRGQEMVCKLDMAWFEEMEELERLTMFENLSPYVTESMYNAYLNDKENLEKKYITLDQERTFCLRNDVLFSSQRMGLPLGIQALSSILFKEDITNMQRNQLDKIIRALAVVKMGDDNIPFSEISPTLQKQIMTGIGKALKSTNGMNTKAIPMTKIPNFVDIQFPKIDTASLDSGRYDDVDTMISLATGMSSALIGGSNGNYAASQANLQTLFARIGVVLEEMEIVWNKVVKVLLGRQVSRNYKILFDTSMPLNKEKELDVLMQLRQQGFSVQSIVGMLSGIEFNDLMEQTIYENDVLKLNEILQPPKTSSTLSGDDNEGGREKEVNPTNDNTIKSAGGNETPRANT